MRGEEVRTGVRMSSRVLFGWTPSRWAVGVPVVVGLAGVLFALSFATAQGTEIRGESRDLPSQILDLSRQVEAKSATLAQLDAQLADISNAQAPANSELKTLRARITALSAGVGTTAVRGPAVSVSLDDAKLTGGVIPPGYDAQDVIVHQQDVQAVVNALWRGGGEAMTIRGKRVIATSAVRCVGNTLILEGQVYSPPYVIEAVGDTAGMLASLEADSAVSIYREYSVAVGLGYSVTQSDDVTMPAYAGSVSMTYATVADK